MASSATTITVSVPPHLRESLVELKRCGEDIPILLHKTVEDFLSSFRDDQKNSASRPEIEYDTLHQISRWAQSEAGKSSLCSHGLGMHALYRDRCCHQSLKVNVIQTPPTTSSSHFCQEQSHLHLRTHLHIILMNLVPIRCRAEPPRTGERSWHS